MKEVQDWIDNIKSLEKQENYEEAYLQSLIGLKAICKNVVDDKESLEVNSLKEHVVANGRSLLQLSDNFYCQDLLTQLFALGRSFQRQPNLDLALNSYETAIEIQYFNQSKNTDQSLNSDQILLMKIYFELACCKEEKCLLDESVSDFSTSLHLAIQNNDVTFEKVILLRFTYVLMKLKLYEEAVSYYLRLLAIREDVKETLNDDMLEFRAHWTVECECEIHYNFCVAYKELHLYEKAIEEGSNYKSLLQLLPNVQLAKPKLKNHYGVTRLMQINSILGNLYELLDDCPSSFSIFSEWLEECKDIVGNNQNSALREELACANEAVGRVAIKLKLYNQASECFSNISLIGESLRDPSIEVRGVLLGGDASLYQRNYEDARNSYAHALKLAQASIDDNYVTECKCMAKEAEVLAKEHRYAHALYRCEQALNLSRKFSNNLEELERQAALYCQHSTSEKELLHGLNFLMKEICFLEEKLQLLKCEGASRMIEEEEKLCKDYIAIQVILCRLGENRLSLAFDECWKARSLMKARNLTPILPSVERKGVTGLSDITNVSIVDSSLVLLPDHCDVTIISYTLSDTGLLSHFVNPRRKLSKSYLSADHVIDAHLTEVTIGQLVKMISGSERSNTSEKLQIFYNIENRNLPDPGQKKKTSFSVGLPTNSKHELGDSSNALQLDGSVECVRDKPERGDAFEKSVDKRDEKQLNKPRNPFKELYNILLQPLQDVIQQLPPQSTVYVSVQGLLARIPFEQLLNPINENAFGDTYNVIMTSCIRVLNTSTVAANNQSCQQSRKVKRDRKNELLRSFVFEKDLEVLQEVGYEKNLSGLVSITASGTNVISSSQYLTPYKQTDFPDKACVIGSPTMPKTLQLNNEIWKPPTRLPNAQKECKKIAEYLDVAPIIGYSATKAEFLKQFSESTVIHVCTFGSVNRGLLAFRPEPVPVESEPVSMDRYVVTLSDLLEVKSHRVKLLVLSSGQTWSRDCTSRLNMDLPHVLLTAGVQSVVFQLWSVPDSVADTFYFHFYLNLQSGSSVSKAVYSAKQATKEKYAGQEFWNAFVAIGNDVTISLSEVRDASLHRDISEIESDKLNPSVLVETERTKSQSFNSVQKSLSSMIGHLDVSRDGDVIPFLLGLLEEATERLAKDENTERPVVVMPEVVVAVTGSLDLLELAGFDFQKVRLSSLPQTTREVFSDQMKDEDARMIVFPHWNQDDLLLPLHQALSGLLEMCSSSDCIKALSLMLPLEEEKLCNLIDLLAFMYHSPHVQLRITDHSVSVLWGERRIRLFLSTFGISNVRTLVVFKRTVANKALLLGALQLLLSVCCHRDRSILKELNLETLGRMSDSNEDKFESLQTFKAVVMPRNEILITSSWMNEKDHVKEQANRKQLATNITQATQKYARVLDHAKWWHQDIRIPKQSTAKNQPVQDADRPISPRKVKVQSGATPSCNRIPLEYDFELKPPNLFEVLRRREDARSVLNKRCVDVRQRHASALRTHYLPYVDKK